MSIHISACLSFFSFISPLVAVRYEQEQYSVEEEAGSVTLALVLDRAVPFPVTVIVNTMDLQDSSVGDAATGELLELYQIRNVSQTFPISIKFIVGHIYMKQNY